MGGRRFIRQKDREGGDGPKPVDKALRGVLDGLYFSVPWNWLLEQPQLPVYPFQKGVLETHTIGSLELLAVWRATVLCGIISGLIRALSGVFKGAHGCKAGRSLFTWVAHIAKNKELKPAMAKHYISGLQALHVQFGHE
ncbi:hypothetical protein CYMTET_42064 [Cymbomonas tetramitiformis]|uniref:Uncharacterized protein n=1 Tax=Cymbomonas tetramitiformis TaxID=36881 RepID=A0AAE0C5Y6_9CHLO|nr:hypothetical protein CYMTET_42064 [Cymbomonas tetramitiformis]